MERSKVKEIKVGQFIKFKYTPEGITYIREVKKVNPQGYNVHIQGILKDVLFLVTAKEIIEVVEPDKECIEA